MSEQVEETRQETQEVPRAAIRKWRRYLADELATVEVLRTLAARKDGEDRKILLELADAEERHAQHWVQLLGPHAEPPPRPTLRHRGLAVLARRFGSVFALALLQRAEGASPYEKDVNVPATMAADEIIHEEVLRGLAAHGRAQLTGNFRAAVFGANDGLVSNVALVAGMAATGVGAPVVLAAGVAGLLAGALSMAAGEYISVRSARELIDASQPSDHAQSAVEHLDLDVNELELVYRARGMDEDEARDRAQEVFGEIRKNGEVPSDAVPAAPAEVDEGEVVGNPAQVALASFLFFASGAFVPIIPYLFGMTGMGALLVSVVLVGIALLTTGSIVGILSGASPGWRAVRQLLIGYGAATVTYLLGLVFDVSGVT